jgi:hypothetical protein
VKSSGEESDPLDPTGDAWSRLRGALKDVIAELEGGEAYLRAERTDFYKPEIFS